jgi:hypothetical protein
MFVKTFIILIVGILIASIFFYAQAQQTDSITITTYFPSPDGAFRDLENKRVCAVGNISASGNTSYDSLAELQNEQLYVGESIILKSLSSYPTFPKPGELIYNSSISKLQFFNSTAWINASAS